MSHELRTPLNAIMGFSQLLQLNLESRPTEESKENARMIYKAGEHLLHLVNDALDLSAIESGKIQLYLERFLILGTICDLINLSQPLAKKYLVQLDDEVDGSDLLIYADKTRFKQALLNLISNAIKYNQINGTVHLKIRELPGQLARISVIDTGPGIESHKFDNIFEPFHRVKPEDSPIEGAGIGLTITRQVVESMNGKVSVESVPGKGSCFSIDLPLGQPPSQDIQALQLDEKSETR